MSKGFNGGGMGGGMNMMRQQQQMQQKIMKMQQKMKELQDQVEAQDFTASVGGGAVSATVSGKKEVRAIAIKPEAVDPNDVEMLQDLIISAVNEALRQAEEAMDKAVNEASGGLDLGAFGM